MTSKPQLAYQVLNSYGYPASNDHNDLCIFGTSQDAKTYIEYLQSVAPEEYHIRLISIRNAVKHR